MSQFMAGSWRERLHEVSVHEEGAARAEKLIVFFQIMAQPALPFFLGGAMMAWAHAVGASPSVRSKR